ncbi:CHAT domain-containing protein, partial [bacterium]|nr:CHAT domain-containing protein [bacterium]
TDNNNISINDLNRLYRKFFQPVEPFLSKEKTLIIIPDGVLYQLPFEMLVTKKGQSYSDSRYILHDYPVAYSVSTGLFIDRLQRESKAPLNYGGFAVTQFPELPALEFATEQVQKAAAVFGRSDYFENERSTKDRLTAKGGEYKILEFATHALVSDAEPLYSKIALWNTIDSIRSDEWLYVHEVYNLKLDADLVSLSGCKTGLGTLTSGEGFIGFNQAFSFAGAASLLMSFWPAEDEATSSVLNIFYENLNKGFSRAEALRRAKLHYLETAHELKRSPHYWASFTLWGNPKPIHFNPSMMWLWIGFGCGLLITISVMFRFKRSSKRPNF